MFFVSPGSYECGVKEKGRELKSYWGHKDLTGDLFTSTVFGDSHDIWILAAFINTSSRDGPLTSSQAANVFSFRLTTRYFLLLGFCPPFPSSRSPHFSFQCFTTTWLINLLLYSYFRKPLLSLFIKLLATWASVLITQKIHLLLSNLPTMQQLYFLWMIRLNSKIHEMTSVI